MAGSEYRKSESGGVTTFEVTPASMPKPIYFFFVGGFICLIGLAVPFLLVVGIAFLIWAWVHDPRPSSGRQPATFKVTGDSLEIGGQTFKRDDIHRLIIKNAVTDQELLTQYSSSANVQAGMAHRARGARIGYTLNVETGGKSTVVAGGMDETTAHGLLVDVCRIMGFNVS
ncbi:MAG TPA: hypothetical protein VHE32_00945 [Rhodanobacteraceae bacterium]|jgi:hypothetical protein|nr:hypothetical protein [Rhodanobacteraceae bacterium]